MKRIHFLHRFLSQLLSQQGYFKDSTQIDDALHFASLSRFEQLYGNDAEYRPGQPLPARAFQLTTAIDDKLQPFLRTKYYGTSSVPGVEITALAGNVLTIPKGWVHPTSFRSLNEKGEYLQDAARVDDNRLLRRLRSSIVGPSGAKPVFETLATGFRFYPAPAALEVKYLALPTRPLYFTEVRSEAAGPEYVDAKSQDYEWPEIEDNDILMGAAQLLGVTVRDALVQQFATFKAQQGA